MEEVRLLSLSLYRLAKFFKLTNNSCRAYSSCTVCVKQSRSVQYLSVVWLSSDMSNTKQDFRSLFMWDSGLPLVFHLPPGPTKKKLAPIIKRHGGEITSRNLPKVIRLADEKLWASRSLLTSGQDFYWPSYIVDCVKCNFLLDIEQYKCSKGCRLMRRIPSEDLNDDTNSEDDFDFGDDMSGRNTVVCVPADTKGRIKYTKNEDMKIMKYLVESGQYRKAKGIAVWKTMEKLEITTHTAQSMMTHFRKVILAQLDNYNIPDNWKTYLTGNLAYFARSTHTSSGGADGNVRGSEEEDADIDTAFLRPSTSKGDQPNHQPYQTDSPTSTTSSRHSLMIDEECLDSFDEELRKMTESDAEGEKGDNTRSGVGAGDPNVGPEPGSSATEPRESAAASNESVAVPGASRGEPDSSTAACAKCLHAKKRQVRGGEKECVDDGGEEDLVLSSGATPEKRLCIQRTPRRKDPRRHRQKAASPADSSVTEESPDKRHYARAGLSTRDSLSQSLLHPVYPQTRHGQKGAYPADSSVTEEGPDKRRSPGDGPSTRNSLSQSALHPVYPQTRHGQKAAPTTDSSVTEEEYRSKGVPPTSDKRHSPRAGPSTRDSLSPDILHPVYPQRHRQKVAPPTEKCVTEEECQSDLTEGYVTEEECQSDLTEGENQSDLTEGVPSTPDKRCSPRARPARDSLSRSSSPVYPMLVASDLREQEQEAEKPGVRKKVKKMTAMEILMALSEEFGLTMSEAQLFYRCNTGHVDATRYWIMTGHTLPGHSFWTPKEDRVLLNCESDDPAWQRLEERHGLSAVLQRIQWLKS